MVWTSKWLALPEPLFIAVFLLGSALTVASVIALFLSIKAKKQRMYFLKWLLLLAVGAGILALIFSHILVASTMLGG